jgi:hypothetical protein
VCVHGHEVIIAGTRAEVTPRHDFVMRVASARSERTERSNQTPTLGWACVQQVRHGARSAARHSRRSAATADADSAPHRVELGVVDGAWHCCRRRALHRRPGSAASPWRSLARATQCVVPPRRTRIDRPCHDVGVGHLRHGAAERPHGATHDLDDGVSDVPRARGTGYIGAADPTVPTAQRCCLQCCTHGWLGC